MAQLNKSALAQWILLRLLPYYGRGFESHAHHLCLFTTQHSSSSTSLFKHQIIKYNSLQLRAFLI